MIGYKGAIALNINKAGIPSNMRSKAPNGQIARIAGRMGAAESLPNILALIQNSSKHCGLERIQTTAPIKNEGAAMKTR